jgi:hypothetical protein
LFARFQPTPLGSERLPSLHALLILLLPAVE